MTCDQVNTDSFPAAATMGGGAAAKATPEPMEGLLCPITYEVMKDPVMAADRFTYERAAIVEWFNRKGGEVVRLKVTCGCRSCRPLCLRAGAISPMTNEKLASTDLFPNHSVRAIISEWLGNQ